MEIMTRAQAFASGLNKYDTGKPCRNGHRAPRYTQSGTCEACIRANQLRAQADYNARAPLRNARKEYGLRVAMQVERIPEAQLESLQTIAEALLTCRLSVLVGEGVELRCNPKLAGREAGTARATFLVHEEDRAAFHAICDDALRTMGLRAVAAHAAAREEAMQRALQP